MESLVHYSNPSHALSVLGVLNEQRLRGQLCDTVLVVGDQQYQAHRSVLAASSEYFQSLFTRRDSEPQKAIQLDFCEADAFEIVLNYMYSSSLFVDKGSLAAIQELGYTLGIPFLTNIMSTAPHVSYCISRKRLSFSEEDDNDGQQKSVIVCKIKGDASLPSSTSTFRGNRQHTPPVSSETAPPPHSFRERGQHPSGPLDESARRSASVPREPGHVTTDTDRKSIGSYASILKGHTSSSVRPQITSSVSFSEAQIQHVRLQVDGTFGPKEEETESHCSPRTPSQRHTSELSQVIDRSGPLIKSLLRRSLSMDSPVPVFSPTLELKELQNREQSVVKTATNKEKQSSSELKPDLTSHQTQSIPPLVLRSRYHNRYEDDDPQEDEVRVKTEPSSPLADPSDIIRITVGDSLPVNIKDFQMNFDTDPRPLFNVTGKRKVRTDNRRYPFKKSRGINEHHLTLDDNLSEPVQHGSHSEDKDEDSEQLKQSKIFKCWSCLKVFRSSAGLHRHVNMYHNPEKPYACDICHKRFHTNFKVWTHSQTQHGVVQNPASSSSSSVLDEKFQKKLIDIVREREIKKALLMKLRRNKQGLLSPQSFAKKRTRAHLCPYCGKTFMFQSHFKQHLKTHPAARADQEAENEEATFRTQDQTVHQKENTGADVYSCRLCNEKLSSIFEHGEHERGCRHATVCPYCGLRFSSSKVKKDHETHCKYKKLTCLECMRTFKSSFSIWRHQVEVHNHNMMTVREQMNLSCDESNGEMPDHIGELPNTQESMGTSVSREDMAYSDSSGPLMFDSEDSSSYMPEDLSVGQHHSELTVKEEPMEEAVSERENVTPVNVSPEEPGVWPCEKCGKLFGSHKDLERHQELLCHIKPFICHICHKAFRTNFRLWSHFQSHMSASDDPGAREADRRPSSPSPSPPLTPQVTVTPALLSSPPITAQAVPSGEEEEPGCSSMTKAKRPDMDRQDSGHSPLSRTDSVENPAAPQESDTLFYHAPSLSALTFKRQYMCKLCHRTFKTAFSLWSHEQSHSHL